MLFRSISATSSIVDIAAGNPSFSTLVAAVQAAGLVDALSGDGPLTVFAPTDEAFAALPEGTVEALLGDIPKLTEILTYHVVSGNAHSSTLTAGSVETLNGATVEISTEGGVMVNDATVVAADILANNGIIHVIDKVILPPSDEMTEPPASDATEAPAPAPGMDDTTSGAAGVSAAGMVLGGIAGAAALLN